MIGSDLLHISDISQIYYCKHNRENKFCVLLDLRTARDWIPILGQHVAALSASDVRENLHHR